MSINFNRKYRISRWDIHPKSVADLSVDAAIRKDPYILLNETEACSHQNDDRAKTIHISGLPSSIRTETEFQLIISKLLQLANLPPSSLKRLSLSSSTATFYSARDVAVLLTLPDHFIKEVTKFDISLNSAAECTDSVLSPFKIYFGNLPHMSAEQLERLCSFFGDIKSLTKSDKNFAIVELKDRSVHNDVIKRLDKRVIAGKEIAVNLASKGKALGIRRGIDLDLLLRAANVEDEPGSAFYILNLLTEYHPEKDAVLNDLKEFLGPKFKISISDENSNWIKITGDNEDIVQLYEEIPEFAYKNRNLITMWCKE